MKEPTIQVVFSKERALQQEKVLCGPVLEGFTQHIETLLADTIRRQTNADVDSVRVDPSSLWCTLSCKEGIQPLADRLGLKLWVDADKTDHIALPLLTLLDVFKDSRPGHRTITEKIQRTLEIYETAQDLSRKNMLVSPESLKGRHDRHPEPSV